MFLSQYLNHILQRFRKQPSGHVKAPELPEYIAPSPTSEDLDWADLAIVDLSQGSTPAGRQELAKQVRQAMNSHGFFYVVNHGYTPEQTRRLFSIANATFDLVEEDEKRLYTGQSEDVYEGYKPRRTWQIENGVSDQIEHYNINRSIRKRDHPTVLRPHLDEIQDFAQHNHNHILYTILRILAIGMDLPEETFVEMHRFESPGESSGSSVSQAPSHDPIHNLEIHMNSQIHEVLPAYGCRRNVNQERLAKRSHRNGLTQFFPADIGSITILWSQPISGLQILSPDGVWRYIKHIENALVVNTGDVMQLLSGGFYKPTIHRVIQPPKDQTDLERLGVFYFAMAADDIRLASVKSDEDSKIAAPTMVDWRKERTGKYGKGTMKQAQADGKMEEEIILGITVKEYN
uniref:Putative Clavaminate synthase-like protein n=1 Tax=Moniliophthora roreri TaxID=221103 RepID=A0A0W0FR40_MONRR